jgi:hypothetical protein
VNREILVARLARAMALVRRYRDSLVISRAAKALLRAANVMASVPEAGARAYELRATAASLGAGNQPSGDRWALGSELELLHAERVPSHRLAHALFDAGCCNGERRPSNLQRCAAWARNERRRFREGSLREPQPQSHYESGRRRGSP